MADKYFKGQTGSDVFGDGSSGNPFQTTAAYSESAGDTLHFAEQCDEQLTVVSGVTYQQWAGQTQCVFDGGGTRAYGIYATGKQDFTLSGLHCTDATTGGIYLTSLTGGADIEDCSSYSNTGYGCRIHLFSTGTLTFADCDFDSNSSQGFRISSGSGGTITYTGGSANSNTTYGVYVVQNSGCAVTIDGVDASANTSYNCVCDLTSGTADITFTNCDFGDSATNSGVLLQRTSSGTVAFNGCTIDNNSGDGVYGGANSAGTITFTNCDIFSNGSDGFYQATLSGADFIIEDNRIYSNTDHGIYVNGVTGGDFDIRRNKVYDNTQHGVNLATVTAADSFLFQHNLVRDNGGAYYGIYLNNADDVSLYRNTIVGGNRGIGLNLTSTGCDISGCIVVDASLYGIDADAGSSPTIDYTCIYNCTTATADDATTAWSAGTGNITSDPDFDNPATDDYHIPSDSPCRDTGTTKTGSSATDLDGENASQHVGPDMGCYEYQPSIVYAALGPEMMQGTTSAGASQVVAMIGPIDLDADDYVKVQGKFSTGDSGAVWLEGKCTVSIRKVGDQ